MIHGVDTPVLSVVMMGATGAVGGSTVKALLAIPQLELLTLLGRRPVPKVSGSNIRQETIDIFDASSYAKFLPGHHTAICTLGVGQPSKKNREDFIRIDKIAVLDFATACKKAAISEFPN